MQINTLQLLNFRCFEDLTLYFNPHFNVLIGDNMSGKTAVLKALSIATTAYSVNMAANGVFNPINREDIRSALTKMSTKEKCVYCETIIRTRNRIRFDIEHFYPKSLYPV